MIATRVFFLKVKLLSATVDLVRRHASEKLVLLVTLMLVAVVAAAPNHANQVSGKPCVRLFVINRPVLIFVGEVAGAERVLTMSEMEKSAATVQRSTVSTQKRCLF